jgi:chromosome segregation ATPase
MKALCQMVLPVVAAALLAGCRSSNYEKGSETGAGLQASADRIGQGQAKIDAAMKSLNDLVNSPGDLATQFKAYSAAVNDLDSSSKDVQSKVASMRSKGNEYFKAWDEQTAQIKNEEIKKRSAERKAEMQKKFTEIKTSYTQASEQFKPFLSDLKDIQTALATDLTPGGVSAIKGAADKANKEAVPLKASFEKLAAQFKDLGVAMQSAAPPPPAPAPAPAK